jgi:hypothetical protein
MTAEKNREWLGRSSIRIPIRKPYDQTHHQIPRGTEILARTFTVLPRFETQ